MTAEYRRIAAENAIGHGGLRSTAVTDRRYRKYFFRSPHMTRNQSMKSFLIATLALTLWTAHAAATPPTVDPTYGAETKVAPFANSPLPPAGMKHLTLWPKSAQAAASPALILGVESLVRPDGPPVKILAEPAGAGVAPAVLVDFGQELAGRLEISGTAGGTVVVTTGESEVECVHKEPKLDNSGPFKLTLAGAEPASTPWSAFRFARLTFPSNAPVELARVVCNHKYYPVQYWGTFDCSDPLLTRIWYAGAYTAHLCMQEEIWDAPKRDRGLWIGDLQVTGQTINNVFADRSLMEHSLALVRDKAQKGRPATELPAADVNNLPGYSAAWFCTLADFYRHAGGRDFLAQQQAKIISLLKYQQTLFDARHRFINPHKEWTYCDWSPGFVLDSPLTRDTTDLYIIQGVHEAVWLLRELGDTAEADHYAAWAEQLTAAARDQLPNAATHTYGDRLQENIMAVLSDTATPEQTAAIYQQVLRAGSPAWTVKPDPSRHDDDPLTPYYGAFLLQSLAKLGHPQDGVDFIRRYWGDLLRRGATTWWEKFDPSWPDDMQSALDKTAYLSLCHGWASGPTPYLSETVLGVRPTGAGFTTVDIRPELGDLTWAEGDVPTPSGLIHVRVERKEHGLTAQVKLPPHIAATIQLGGKTLTANQTGTYRLAAP